MPRRDRPSVDRHSADCAASDLVTILSDDGEPTGILVEKGSEPWHGKNGKTMLFIAIIAAIIAELATLAVSRKH